MIKLDGKVKYGNLPSEIQTHLTPIVTKDDKIALLFCIVVFLDLVCTIPLLVVADLFMSYMYLLMACLSSYVGIKFVHQFIFVKANQDIINQRLGKGRFSNDPK
ncbi:hypothetical protein [Bacillus swezeyi]|uniref:hypothetical protein n=1 Tax=Bacillus swezeyi TaxID=1925020 RepID=UPI003F8A6559